MLRRQRVQYFRRESAGFRSKQKGIAVLRVDTNTQNPATQRLLPKLGYTFAGEMDLSFRPGLRFFCYEKRLDLQQESGLA